MNIPFIAEIFIRVSNLIQKIGELFGKKEKDDRITIAFDKLQRQINFTTEEIDRIREAFEKMNRSCLHIIDDAFKCLRIHYTLALLKSAKPLKVITFAPIFLTNLKTSFQMWPKPKGCAYPSLSNNVA